jgi:hypothetical protein
VVAGLSTTWSFSRYSDPSSRRPQRFRCSKSGGQVKTNRITHQALAYATRRSTRLLYHAVGRCKFRRSPMVRCARRQSRDLRRATQRLTGDFGVRGLSARLYVKCSLTAGLESTSGVTRATAPASRMRLFLKTSLETCGIRFSQPRPGEFGRVMRTLGLGLLLPRV